MSLTENQRGLWDQSALKPKMHEVIQEGAVTHVCLCDKLFEGLISVL